MELVSESLSLISVFVFDMFVLFLYYGRGLGPYLVGKDWYFPLFLSSMYVMKSYEVPKQLMAPKTCTALLLYNA